MITFNIVLNFIISYNAIRYCIFLFKIHHIASYNLISYFSVFLLTLLCPVAKVEDV